MDPGAKIKLLLVLLGTVAACERLNPQWCNKPGRCPVGTTCDPTTNTCLEARHDSVTRPPDLRVPARDLQRDSSLCAVAGGWICSGGTAGRCREGGFTLKRNCPLEACAAGHCGIPSGAKSCTSDLACPVGPGVWVCTWLLEEGKTPKQVCVPAVAGANGPGPCSSGLDCASGLCTSKGRCYDACDDSDCPVDYSCQDITIFVEGVQKPVKSCLPI